ncbi:MAG: cupredoxin domain-containing protein [Actinomycetota bacterium]
MSQLAVVVAILAATTLGCVRGDPEDIGDPSPAATTAEASTDGEVNDHGTETFTTETFELELELDNFYYEPTYIKAPGGSTATIELFNEGSAPHTFTIDALEVDEELQPNERKAVEVELGTETRYELYCRFHGDQGMRGAFMPH